MEFLGFAVPAWFVFLAVISAGLTIPYRRLTRTFGYWESQGVPFEKPYPMIGTELPMLKKSLNEVDLERQKKFGRIYGLYFRGCCILSVAEPDIIKHILVKDFHIFINRQKMRTGIKLADKGLTMLTNEDWKRVRSVISPTFSTGKMKKMAVLVKNHAEKLTKNFLQAANKGEIVESKTLVGAYTMDVIGSCAFGVEVDSLQNPDHPFVVNGRKIFNKGVTFSTLLLFFLPYLKFIGNYIMRAGGFQYFADVAADMLQLRRTENAKGAPKRVDFLQLMLDAQEGKLEKTEEDNPTEDNNYTQDRVDNKPWVSNKTITEDEIQIQCFVFLVGGYEPTAQTINYVIYNLAMHPEIQDKLLQEVDEAWNKNDDITYEIANKMKYLNAVVSETMRKFAIGSRLIREASEDYTIPNMTIVVPKGGQIHIPIHALHHDPEFFPEPEKFNPDRFLPENKGDLVPYSYLPFGDGPRNCLGMRFALMGIKLCLVHLLRQVKFVATEETKKPLEFLPAQGFQVKSILVKPEKRTKLCDAHPSHFLPCVPNVSLENSLL